MTDRTLGMSPDERLLLTASPHLKSPDEPVRSSKQQDMGVKGMAPREHSEVLKNNGFEQGGH